MKKLILLITLFLFSCSSPNEPDFTNVSINFVSYKNLKNTKGTITITVSGTTELGYSIIFSTESNSNATSTFFLPKDTAIKITFITDISNNPDTVNIKAKNDLKGQLKNEFIFEYQYQ